MFKKKDGYFTIVIKDEELYMRDHPKTMLASMKYKKHNMFITFRDTVEKTTYDATIEDLEKYIKEVEDV